MTFRSKSFFSLFYVLFFIIVIIGALGYNSKARLIPLVVALPCLGLSIIQFALDLGKEKKRGRSIEDDLFHGVMEKMVHQEVVADDEGKKGKKRRWEAMPFFRIIGWLLFFYVSVYLFGFLITIPLFTILFMRSKGERWILSLSCGAGLWLTIYLAFVVAARISLHEGLVFRLLGGE